MTLYANSGGICTAHEIIAVNRGLLGRDLNVELVDGGSVLLPKSAARGFDPVAGDFYVKQAADGYEYLCPREAFLRKYRKSGEMTFGDALFLLQQGYTMTRPHNAGAVIKMVGDVDGDEVPDLAWLLDGKRQFLYRPINHDLFATDWIVVDTP